MTALYKRHDDLKMKPHIMVFDKEQKTAFVIHVSVPVDSNIRKEEHENIQK